MSDHCFKVIVHCLSGDTMISSYWTQFFILGITQAILYVLGEHISEHVYFIAQSIERTLI